VVEQGVARDGEVEAAWSDKERRVTVRSRR
jgi:hypothetical protein